VMSVFRSGHEIGTTVVLFGADTHQTPIGTHSIRGKVRDYHSRAYSAPMPYTLWLTSDGVAIHASDVRRGRATHGCIGVPSEFAERLFGIARVGDQVRILRTSDQLS
jgi:lipoprotein-anchoring transpeptidase ErfK/SrfK